MTFGGNVPLKLGEMHATAPVKFLLQRRSHQAGEGAIFKPTGPSFARQVELRVFLCLHGLFFLEVCLLQTITLYIWQGRGRKVYQNSLNHTLYAVLLVTASLSKQ